MLIVTCGLAAVAAVAGTAAEAAGASTAAVALGTVPEDGKLYRCERTGEQLGGKVTLQFLPHELVGLYFTEV